MKITENEMNKLLAEINQILFKYGSQGDIDTDNDGQIIIYTGLEEAE